MAPGVGALPAAEAEVPVAEPIARYLSKLPAGAVRRIRLALLVFDWMSFPWRFSRSSLEARQDFLRRMDASPRAIHSNLLLFLKVLTGLGYGNHPSVREAVGYEARCGVREDAASPPRRCRRTPSVIWRRRRAARTATSSSSGRAREAPSRRRSSRRRGTTCWCSRPAPTRPPQLSRRAARGADGALSRGRPHGRRGPSVDPGAGRSRRRRDTVINSGTCAAEAGRRPGAEQRDVVVGQVRGVDRGEALRQRAGVGQQHRSACGRAPRGTPRSPSAARTRGRAAAARPPTRQPRAPTPGRPRARCGSPRRRARWAALRARRRARPRRRRRASRKRATPPCR